MNLKLLTILKTQHINAIKLNIIRINKTEYVFLKFILIIFIGFNFIISIYAFGLCIFSHDQIAATRFYMGVCFLLSFGNAIILYVVYVLLFDNPTK